MICETQVKGAFESKISRRFCALRLSAYAPDKLHVEQAKLTASDRRKTVLIEPIITFISNAFFSLFLRVKIALSA